MSSPRVVSLVPSITEAIASVDAKVLVGATAWCTHPSDLVVTRVRGTKNPDLNAIRRLKPDYVIANQEENREVDVQRLRADGIRVIVTRIESVPEAIATYETLFTHIMECRIPGWLKDAKRRWCGPYPSAMRRVVIPIWRDPWRVIGKPTFTNDLALRLGWDNIAQHLPTRYPKVTIEEIWQLDPDVVVLPDEPYVFTVDDGPEEFAPFETELVSGRLLTWYGPSRLDAARLA